MLPAAGLILLVALLLAGTAVPWSTAILAARAEASQATARGELSAAVVDLLEGAPELIVNGAAGAQLARTAAADAELTRVASATARTAGVGQGLEHAVRRDRRCGAAFSSASRPCARGTSTASCWR